MNQRKSKSTGEVSLPLRSVTIDPSSVMRLSASYGHGRIPNQKSTTSGFFRMALENPVEYYSRYLLS